MENFEEFQESMTNVKFDQVYNEDEEDTKEKTDLNSSNFGCPFKRPRLDDSSELAELVAAIENDEMRNQLNSHSDDTPMVVEDNDGLFGVDEDYDVSDEDSDFEEDIESMLDQALPDEMKNKSKKDYEERFKIVLDEKGRNHFEVLPEGWVQITHNSGMPLYLHRHSRVCSLSRPYFLGGGSVRKHQIPISAIPCLNYQKALEKEVELLEQQRYLQEQHDIEAANMQRNEAEAIDQPSVGLSALLNLNKPDTPMATKAHLPPIPNAKVETVSEFLKEHSLAPDEFTEYCKKKFRFKTIRVMRFKSWSARRKFSKNRKQIKHLQRRTLPDGTKLITFPVLNAEPQDSNAITPASQARPKKEWVMNPNGKSYVCILHEYVQHAWKKQPTYEFKELENSATPYSATVSINDLKYGIGYGTSKKQAKSEAARETLEVLIPEMKEKISGVDKNSSSNGAASAKEKSAQQDLSVFDEIKIEDPRVPEFCQKTTEPSPHSILLTCLQRNYGYSLSNIDVKYEVNTAKHKKNEYTMSVGAHKVKVFCKNKKDGKQKAAQAILKLLHPHITTWGPLLRLYGNNSVKSFKEKKQEEQEITVLQNKAIVNQPNYAILEKLKEEMLKLKTIKPRNPITDSPMNHVITTLQVPVNPQIPIDQLK